jgi:catechol 2,3-dioxygenase-like lactoylglutathione lyase family enzyme
MSRVTMIHHINIQVSDREKTQEWYEKVLGAEFLDRGPTLNRQQLQFRIGNSEVHTNDTPNPIQVATVHFAAEIADWDELIAHLDELGIPYSTALRRPPGSEEKSSWERREYSGNHYTYVTDPNGNIIELVHHPLGIADSHGNKVEIAHNADSLKWVKRAEYDDSR